MTISRESQVSLEATSFYHCYVRCVRRAFLCGIDHSTGDNFDHRKQWLVSRIRFLSYVYAIDVCAYAVMSNHYHVVLHVDQEKALSWTMEEVVERWLQLYKGGVLVERWLKNPKSLSKAEMEKLEELVELWRERLYDISWFMRGINETIARMANEEENCKGRFWEGRFKSQALLDEAALLSCMAYVDLNPVRAAMADDLLESDFTSIQQRIMDYSSTKAAKQITKSCKATLGEKKSKQQQLKNALNLSEIPEQPLMLFGGSAHNNVHNALPFTLQDYFDLVDCTGRAVREDKRGYISPQSSALIQRLGIDLNQWLEHVTHFGRRYGRCVGSVDSMQEYAEHFQQRWTKGVGISRTVYRDVRWVSL